MTCGKADSSIKTIFTVSTDKSTMFTVVFEPFQKVLMQCVISGTIVVYELSLIFN